MKLIDHYLDTLTTLALLITMFAAGVGTAGVLLRGHAEQSFDNGFNAAIEIVERGGE